MRGKIIWLPGIFLFILLFSLSAYCSTAMAINQEIGLKAGWNLISFAVKPTDPTVETVLDEIITNGIFVAMWTYDAETETWMTYPPPLSAIPAIDHVEASKGYWLKVTSAATLAIAGEEFMPGDIDLFTGWNLVGFAAKESKPYDRVFFELPMLETWKYDAAAGQFKGVELPAGPGEPVREDFTQLDPGTGYWVYASEPFTLAPFLGTSMEGDKDLPPLLTEDLLPGVRLVWSEVSPGDEDIGMDGYYDRPDTQRALTFRDSLNSQNISIYNTGSGILQWNAQVENPQGNPWLRFMIWDDEEGKEVPVEDVSGSVTTDTAILRVDVDRTGLTPGDYNAKITIAGNGGGAEPSRDIDIHMNVATIKGDYKVLVHIDTVNGKKADMHNPRLFLSLYNDKDGLKGIIDPMRTLLMPERFYMIGEYYEDNTNHFIVSGSFELPKGHVDNPYQVALRRDITLIGDRSSLEDPLLGPLDLKGEYGETIRNVLDEPIYLAGTFTATRIQNQPSTIDSTSPEGDGEPIPDDGTSLEKTITVGEKMIITEVDVTVNLTHTRPSDLNMSLFSPAATEVMLRERSTALVGEVTYDTDQAPVGNLEDFNGEMSNGEWTLRIEDREPGETGELISWSLDIKGTRVHSIGGNIANVGEGATVLLTGCGISLITTTGPGGSFRFENLIDCIYTITVYQQGYETITLEVHLSGQDITDVSLTPEKQTAQFADFIFSPGSGLLPLSVSFTDISPSVQFQPGHEYTYTWTFSRMVGGAPQPFAVRSQEGPRITQVFGQSGIYVARMEVFDKAFPGIPALTVDKTDQYITVGPSGDSSNILTHYTTAGGGGWFAPLMSRWYPEKENAFDSATFDIDRAPGSSNPPGNEDTDAFTGETNPLTLTNQYIASGNNRIDDPAGPGGDLSNHFHIFVNIGQPVAGMSVSGDKVLSIGANP